MVKIGIIGGSGLDNPDILHDAQDISLETPYGPPSSDIRAGTIAGREVYLLARHGRGHTIPPTQVNYRANIYAMKTLGCSCLLSTTAVGSLREEIGRGDLVILDQFIDFTKLRVATFHDSFEPGNPAHTPMADPFAADIRAHFIDICRELGFPHHARGTVVTIEGPRFSTRAESKMFQTWGADVINMSIAPEAALANEAGIPYGAVAMSTDYDCWKQDEEPVTWDDILRVFNENARKVTTLLVETIKRVKM